MKNGVISEMNLLHCPKILGLLIKLHFAAAGKCKKNWFLLNATVLAVSTTSTI